MVESNLQVANTTGFHCDEIKPTVVEQKYEGFTEYLPAVYFDHELIEFVYVSPESTRAKALRVSEGIVANIVRSNLEKITLDSGKISQSFLHFSKGTSVYVIESWIKYEFNQEQEQESF
jgi:hypothetical protein